VKILDLVKAAVITVIVMFGLMLLPFIALIFGAGAVFFISYYVLTQMRKQENKN